MKIFWITTGFICFVLGTVGIVLPILPTVPLYLAAAVCFAKGSERLHSWFKSTDLYKNHVKSFAENKEMTKKAKVCTMCSITALMLVGFVMMKNILIGRIILTAVWAAHIIYFLFIIKTAEANGNV